MSPQQILGRLRLTGDASKAMALGMMLMQPPPEPVAPVSTPLAVVEPMAAPSPEKLLEPTEADPAGVVSVTPVPVAVETARAAASTRVLPTTTPASVAPVIVPVAPVVVSATASESSPRLRSAKFVVDGTSERIDVVCGDVHSNGMGNALLQAFPAGRCTVSTAGLTTTVDVQEPRKVDCMLQGGTLSCH